MTELRQNHVQATDAGIIVHWRSDSGFREASQALIGRYSPLLAAVAQSSPSAAHEGRSTLA